MSLATPSAPAPVHIRCDDGFALGGRIWRHREPADGERSVVIVNPATSVRQRYYARFADFLFTHGFDVITFDYRGIGDSRPGALRGFRAGWVDWGRRDFEAVLRFAVQDFPGRPVDVVAHSIGGFAIGLAPSNPVIRRIFTMGAQYAYWRDYDPGPRLGMALKWHIVMPLLARLWGYVPARRLGWMEDTPKGVALDWAGMPARFETRPGLAADDLRAKPIDRFAAVTAPILALSLTDDPFGTTAAIERLLAYFVASARTHLRLAPTDVGESAIGHFAFFHDRHRERLWPIPLEWLTQGTISARLAHRIVSRAPAGSTEGPGLSNPTPAAAISPSASPRSAFRAPRPARSAGPASPATILPA